MSADNIPTSEDKPVTLKPPEPPMKCPRCDSPNTKFCYYNNYSLTQPRHFCKTCRRYWTKGGALRNVPIGGGCRKNKRSTKSTSRVSCGDSKDSTTSSHSGGFKLFQGLSPAMDFQLGGVGVGGGGELPFSILHSSPVYNTTNNHQFVSLGENLSTAAAAATINPSSFDIDSAGAAAATSGSLMGFNLSSYPAGLGGGDFKSDGGIREMGSMNVHSSLASSIESLSCINQDLHWKLQQQRLATLFGGEASPKGGEGVTTAFPLTVVPETQTQKRDPITFQNLGMSKQEVSAVDNLTTKEKGMSGSTTITDWFFENSYTTPPSTATTNTKNSNSGSNENDNSSNWNGIQAWTNLHQFSELP